LKRMVERPVLGSEHRIFIWMPGNLVFSHGIEARSRKCDAGDGSLAVSRRFGKAVIASSILGYG
jgi:hypothetical protein